MQAIVDAVPMVIQCPAERDMHASASVKSCGLRVPAFSSSSKRHTAVPEPISWPRYLPLSIGPPETTSAGTLQLAAPITKEGVVLSQPHKSTTPSIGLARIDSSTSMLTRFLNSIAVGRMLVSPIDITGNSRGKPPTSQTPRFTRSAIWRKCALQGVSSDQVLQMPMNRASIENMIRQTLVAHPAAMHEAVFICFAEPCSGTILAFVFLVLLVFLVGHESKFPSGNVSVMIFECTSKTFLIRPVSIIDARQFVRMHRQPADTLLTIVLT